MSRINFYSSSELSMKKSFITSGPGAALHAYRMFYYSLNENTTKALKTAKLS